jgi:hypothetical protein
MTERQMPVGLVLVSRQDPARRLRVARTAELALAANRLGAGVPNAARIYGCLLPGKDSLQANRNRAVIRDGGLPRARRPRTAGCGTALGGERCRHL